MGAKVLINGRPEAFENAQLAAIPQTSRFFNQQSQGCPVTTQYNPFYC
jgi:hypothetical protein